MVSNKVKILLIYDFLKKYSDEEHPVSTARLLEMLEEKGIPCSRKTVYSDIEALNTADCEIMLAHGTGGGYFVGSRDFELPEVMLLIDAVTSAGFITPKKTASLVEKLKNLVSVGQAQSMVSRVYYDYQSVKCANEEIYIIIDRLHDAITHKRQVRFTYTRRSIDTHNKKRITQKVFTVSPYALIWKDDHYYLICNKQKYDNLMNLRIDRMKHLEILDLPVRPVSEVSPYKTELDTRDYSAKMFNMFSGEECEVTLKCSLKLQEEMLDRFGASIPLKAADPSHFSTKVKATLSDGLVSWIMQYGADVEVTSPPELVEMIKAKAGAISAVYAE